MREQPIGMKCGETNQKMNIIDKQMINPVNISSLILTIVFKVVKVSKEIMYVTL